jgi:hypothetical protein
VVSAREVDARAIRRYRVRLPRNPIDREHVRGHSRIGARLPHVRCGVHVVQEVEVIVRISVACQARGISASPYVYKRDNVRELSFKGTGSSRVQERILVAPLRAACVAEACDMGPRS